MCVPPPSSLAHPPRRLSPHRTAGLFYFDASYRPVPLEMQFVGVSERNVLARLGIMDEVCYQKVGCAGAGCPLGPACTCA